MEKVKFYNVKKSHCSDKEKGVSFVVTYHSSLKSWNKVIARSTVTLQELSCTSLEELLGYMKPVK